jgi:hypothetical protein
MPDPVARTDVRLPITAMRVQQRCPVCDLDARVEVDVYSLDPNGAELIATLVGCTECRTGLARPS